MSRPKGSKNKAKSAMVETFTYTTDQRVELVADLIIERIIDDQRNGRLLLNIMEASNAAK